MKFKRIHIIINPASGQDRPMLAVFNTVFGGAGIEWDVSVTKAAGDATRIAREAAEAGVDAVAVYGGDGTITEAATGLIGSGVPLAILPGGTANAVALALGIPPADLQGACELITREDSVVRPVDLGSLGDRHFLIGVGIGIPGQLAEDADRESKDRLGVLAYAISSIQAVRNAQTAMYHLTLDGRTLDVEGVTAVIANAGNFGIPGLNLAPTIDLCDGLLDVLVIRRADIPAIISLAASLVRQDEASAPFEHWQARDVQIVAEPAQPVQADGEVLPPGPVTAHALPAAVHFVVPGDTTIKCNADDTAAVA